MSASTQSGFSRPPQRRADIVCRLGLPFWANEPRPSRGSPFCPVPYRAVGVGYSRSARIASVNVSPLFELGELPTRRDPFASVLVAVGQNEDALPSMRGTDVGG